MKKFIATLLAVLIVSFGLTAFAVTPANAGPLCQYSGSTFCGVLTHTSDDGYDPDIIVTCKGAIVDGKFTSQAGYSKYVPEGTSSRAHCEDMDGVYVRSGEEIWCNYPTRFDPSNYKLTFDAWGWHKVDDTWKKNCVAQVD